MCIHLTKNVLFKNLWNQKKSSDNIFRVYGDIHNTTTKTIYTLSHPL